MTAPTTGFQLRGAAPAQLRASRPAAPRCLARASVRVLAADKQRTVLIGLAADSGCGKSTFMRRMTNLFGGNAKPPAGGNPDSNTLIRCGAWLFLAAPRRATEHGSTRTARVATLPGALCTGVCR